MDKWTNYLKTLTDKQLLAKVNSDDGPITKGLMRQELKRRGLV